MNKVKRKIGRIIFLIKRYGLQYFFNLEKLKKGKLEEDEFDEFMLECETSYYKDIKQNQYAKELEKRFNLFSPNYGGDGNIKAPKTYNEKIQWIKINGNIELMTKLADKYKVRDWVKDRIGEQYLIPFLGVWENPNEIDFDSLPNCFVLKANYSCGMNIIVKNKNNINKELIISQLTKWMNLTYGYTWFETQYIQIPKRIIAEKYIEQLDGGLIDYKIHCFNGEPQFVQIIGDRNGHTGRQAFMDIHWNKLNFSTGDYPLYEHDLERPVCFEEMIEVSRKLSKEFYYVRVDLYEIDGKVKFGELTFTPYAGLYNWNPPETNIQLGKMIKLPCDDGEV